MGFKPVPYARPLYCWTEPGHIFVEEVDGSVSDYESHIKVAIPKQLNDFRSETAMWVLDHDGCLWVGNKFGTYGQFRKTDGVLMSYGGWFMKSEREFPVIGSYKDYAVRLDTRDFRTIYIPTLPKVYRLNRPMASFDALDAFMCWERGDGELNLIIEGRPIDLGTEGTWLSTPELPVGSRPIIL